MTTTPNANDIGVSGGPIIGTAVAATVATALPGFLVGALAVQIRADFDVSAARYGWAMSGYFLAATAGSVGLGRVAQRIGPRQQLVIALVAAALTNLAVAAFADSFATLVALLAAAGVCNAGCQTAVNLALTRAGLPRLGLAIAVKQSGVPTASMLAGLAVPALALTVGWRWAFVAIAAITSVAALAVVRTVAPAPNRPMSPETSAPPEAGHEGSPAAALLGAAIACAFLAFGAGALNAWVVSSGVDAGLGEGAAGLTLSGGAALGVAIRLGWGLRLDSLDLLPFRVGGLLSLAGSVGVALLAVRSVPVHLVATVVGFAGGWIWPVFTNFGVIRANVGRAAAATGVSQTGVYVGTFVAPLATGWLIEAAGYGPMWLVTAAAMAAGSVVAIRVAHHF